MDGEVFQGEATDRNADINSDPAARHHHSDVQLQEPCGHRPGARLHPRVDGVRLLMTAQLRNVGDHRSKTNEEWREGCGHETPTIGLLAPFPGGQKSYRAGLTSAEFNALPKRRKSREVQKLTSFQVLSRLLEDCDRSSCRRARPAEGSLRKRIAPSQVTTAPFRPVSALAVPVTGWCWWA